MFSARVPAQLEPNALSRAIGRARLEGRPLIDLTLTNPTRAGISYPASGLAGLSHPDAAVYDPEPFGLPAARNAVSTEFARRGIDVPASRIVLTASTSEAYSLIFKLLCAPHGDSVLVPVPSYPLFEHLTRLEGVQARSYPLEYQGRWHIEFAALDREWTPDTRAILAVSPNNPTGSVLDGGEVRELQARCLARRAALILDEVFADYPLEADGVLPGFGAPGALTFRLGGLSKSAALPQVKLGWIAVDGPEALVRAALDRLELICDTYLSVSTPVQHAAAGLIAAGASARRQVLDRVRSNYELLKELAERYPAVDVLRAEAGWSAVLRIPSWEPEEQLCVDLVERASVVVHPGYFFDFPHEGFLVVSLLPPPDVFREGLCRVLERVNG